MKKTEFKIGDIVELIEDFSPNTKKGATGKIFKLNDSFVFINWVRNNLSGNQSDGGYIPSRFKLHKRTWRQMYGKT